MHMYVLPAALPKDENNVTQWGGFPPANPNVSSTSIPGSPRCCGRAAIIDHGHANLLVEDGAHDDLATWVQKVEGGRRHDWTPIGHKRAWAWCLGLGLVPWLGPGALAWARCLGQNHGQQ